MSTPKPTPRHVWQAIDTIAAHLNSRELGSCAIVASGGAVFEKGNLLHEKSNYCLTLSIVLDTCNELTKATCGRCALGHAVYYEAEFPYPDCWSHGVDVENGVTMGSEPCSAAPFWEVLHRSKLTEEHWDEEEEGQKP